MSKQEIKILLLLASAQFTNIVDFMIMMPLGPQLMDMFSISTSQFSLLVSVYSLSAGVSAVLSSFIVDDFDRKKSFLTIYSGFLIGTFLCASASSYHFLLAARIFTGFFGGIISSQVLSIVGDLIQPSHRGRAMAITMASFSAASVLGIPLGLFLASQSTWHTPFFCIVGVGFFVLLYATKTLPPMRGHLKNKNQAKRSRTEIYPYILKRPKLIWALSLFPMLMMAHFIIIPFISPYLASNVGFTNLQLSYVYFCGGGFTLFSTQIIGRSVDKYGAYKVFRTLAFLALIPIAILTRLPPVPIWVALIVTTAFFVVGSARTIPAITAVTGTIEPRFRGGFMSINAALQQLGAGLASFIAGLIVSKGPDGKLLHYEVTSYVVLAATIMCLFIFSKFKDMKMQPAIDPIPPEVVT
jgi:predicted MFS family arabinose efflux permease